MKKMKRFLVFWPVENPNEIGRHDFEGMADTEIWKALPNNSRVYDLDKADGHGKCPDMENFTEDYNDEELDGGWWSTVVIVPEEILP